MKASELIGFTSGLGPAGPQGPQGVRGDKGEKGEKGDQGLRGNTGPQGPAGQFIQVQASATVAEVNALPTPTEGDGYLMTDAGVITNGSQSVSVAAGDVVAWVADGYFVNYGDTRGPQGEQGPIGQDGAQGARGPVGPEGPSGQQGPLGPQGTQGPAGPQGVAGPQGSIGPQGPQGAAGQGVPLNGSTNDTLRFNGSEWISTNVLQIDGTGDVVVTNSLKLGPWSITETAGDLVFNNGANRMRLTSAGNLVVAGDVTAFGAP